MINIFLVLPIHIGDHLMVQVINVLIGVATLSLLFQQVFQHNSGVNAVVWHNLSSSFHENAGSLPPLHLLRLLHHRILGGVLTTAAHLVLELVSIELCCIASIALLDCFVH